MKITCLHGYFIFRESIVGETAKFNTMYGQNLSAKDDYYTFSKLVGTPDYSLVGSPFLDLVGLVAFEGKPWDLLQANGFVYDFSLKALTPLASVTNRVTFTENLSYSMSYGLVQPGSYTSDWQQIVGYQCVFDLKFKTFNYTDFFYA